MKIRDIVNRDIVNLTNCESEPIHIPGSIQPHGFLLGINEKKVVEYCSGNVESHTGFSYTQILGSPVNSLFAEDGPVIHFFTKQATASQTPIPVQFGEKSFTCTIHKSDTIYIAEFEPAEEEALELSELYNLNLKSINALQNADDLKKLCQAIAGQIKELTGYDRVMIYRFDEQYNGEIYAESKEEYLEAFLGLHYPHTDIPVQARQLYIKNLLRVIVDVNYTPSPIYTIDTSPDKNLDLGMASLRSVSPIHIQYLQNMGVSATLTISLLHEGRLWGLVACHHYNGSKHLSAYTRVSAQLLGHLLTSQIKVRQVAEEYQVAILVNNALEKLLSDTNIPDRVSFAKVVQQPQLLSLCNAGGVAIVFDGTVFCAGNTPSEEAALQIASTLRPLITQDSFVTHKLKEVYPSAEACCDTASGVIYHHIEGPGENDCIIWFRGETLEEVHWAGDPEKAIIKNEKGLSPRKSFELWREIIKCSSQPWGNPELTAAATFTNTLQKHIHLLLLSEEETRYRSLSEQLTQANAELENMQWISTHDLREPLRKIQVLSSRILAKEKEDLSEMVVSSIERLSESAGRMQKLISDITAYGKLRHNKDVLLDADLSAIMREVIDELSPDLEESEGLAETSPLPVIKGVPVLLKQLFINLLSNSIKFRKPDTPPQINIHYTPNTTIDDNNATRYHRIEIVDNGIGIDNTQKENIFRMFTRLHSQDDYTGSGIGLALCRQIMNVHNGYIQMDGRPGEGTSFYLYFPAAN